jgi:hypothetical protein
MDYIHLAQNMNQLSVLLNKAVNFRVPYNI